MKNRLDPKVRKEQILQAALDLAAVCGTERLLVKDVASKSETSAALVMYYFKTMPQLRRSVMRAAVSRGLVPIVARGLASKDPYANKASPELRAQAAKFLSAQLTA